jgi:hypothetical protein
MDYQNLYDVIYNTLYTIPTVIIENIIFKYIVESNKYEYKYMLTHDEPCHGIHINKQLNIICCEFSNYFKLFDYHGGTIHDGSIIDIESLDGSFRMLYFDNDIILMRDTNAFVCKYILDKTKYKLICKSYMHRNKNMCVYNDHIYSMDQYTIGNKHVIEVFCLEDFMKIETNHYSPKNSMWSQIYVHDELICVYNVHHNYIHDTDFNIVGIFDIPCGHSCEVYKNKLYCLLQHTIYVYNILTMEQINMIHISQCRQDRVYTLRISGDTIILNACNDVIFIEIK